MSKVPFAIPPRCCPEPGTGGGRCPGPTRRSTLAWALAGVAWCMLAVSFLTGCGDAKAEQEDARILAEFRGPHFIPAGERRPNPTGPPYVPHVVYRENFDCLVCHGHADFRFRGQPVKRCPHPERSACLQCHVPWQSQDAPFKFDVLGSGTVAVTTPPANPAR